MIHLLRFIRDWLGPRRSPSEIDNDTSGELYEAMMKKCPCCGLKPPSYMEGPAGGMTVNIFCAKCGEGWNVSSQLMYAEKIHQDAKYILPIYRGENMRHGT